ncbi:MAG: Fe-S cluster assembly protein SufD [Alphaproteobacteria bacterium]|nr:Fe-S cluster assembly protein SufD [Alphaproteobacteria bacterium]
MTRAAEATAKPVETAEEQILAAFSARAGALPGARHPAVRAAREEAMAHFAVAGLPHRRMEAWKYTDLSRRLSAVPGLAPLDAAPAESAPAFDVAGWRVARFAGGSLASGPEDGGGAHLVRLSEALDEGASRALDALKLSEDADSVAALVAALAHDGILVTVPKGAHVALPLGLVLRAAQRAPEASFVRLSVRVEEGADLTLVEDHAGRSGLAMVHLDARLEAGARLAHLRLQDEGAGLTHLARSDVRLARDAHYVHGFASLGAGLSRHELRITLEGSGAQARLLGAWLAGAGRHADTTTLVRHAAPHCTSLQTIKGVVAPEGRGVFQGLVSVARGAAGTSGHQLAKALLLGPRAEVDQKPELEIFADDVKCSHGASVGELDEDALFYLRARGLPEPQARALLTGAFLGEIFDGLTESFGGALADVVRVSAEAGLAAMTRDVAAGKAGSGP